MTRLRARLSVLIAGGGTGGHLYPGIAVARELMDRQPEARVHRRVGKPLLGGHGDLSRKLGKHFRPHGILTALAVHDVLEL